MNKDTVYGGIDVGKEEVYVAVAGRKPRAFTHSVPGMRSLIMWVRKAVGKDAVIHLCMEATGVYSRSVACKLLAVGGVTISIVNPAQIAAFARAQLRRTKTDRVDAEVIRQFAVSQHPRPWVPEPQRQRRLYELICQRDAVQRLSTQISNRDASLSFVPDVPPEVVVAQRALQRTTQKQLRLLEEAILRLCAEDSTLAQDIALLITIPGIAHITAVHLLAYGGATLDSHTPKQLAAHAGLAPRHHQSGISIARKSTLAKQGNARLRKSLYMAALTGKTHNPTLKRLYRRLITNGKPPKLALAACMRKLLLIAQAILKTRKPFNPALCRLT